MSVLEEVKKAIARITRYSESDISEETLLKDIKADSLHWVQIIVSLEDAFDIEIDFEKMKDFTTVADFVSYVESCRE